MEAESPSAPEPARPTGSEDEGERERFGPLVLRRVTKDDGRALILYGLAEDPRGEGN